MKFLCEYCGNVIDTNEIKNGGCPICNADLSNNKAWEKFQNREEQMNDFAVEQERIKTEGRQFNLNTKKEMYKSAKGITKGVKIFIIIVAVFMAISILGTMILSILSIGGIGATFFSIFQQSNEHREQMEDRFDQFYSTYPYQSPETIPTHSNTPPVTFEPYTFPK